MAEEPKPKPDVSATGAGAAGIGGDAKDVQIQTSHIDQRGGQVLDHPVFHGPTTIVQQTTGTGATPSCTPPQRLAYIRFPALGPKFAGRTELLATLTRELQPGQAAGLSQRAALQADGGVGKTALAVELGWRLFDEGRFAYVLLLNATAPDTLSTDLAGLCERDRLNLPEQQATDQKTRFQGVLAWLQAPDNARRTLLILDNADTLDAQAAVRALHPRLPGCALLVTSRAPVGGGIPQHTLALFTAEEARAFLHTHLDPKHLCGDETTTTALLDGLAAAVDHLPLALEIACSYLRETYQSPREWLREWQATPGETLQHHNPADLSYPVSLSRVWEQSFARLTPEARLQLQLLCWLAPRPAALPLAALKKMADWTERRKWLGELEKLSLIQRSQGEADPVSAGEGDSITIHRILQAVVRARTSDEDRAAARAAAAALLDSAILDWECDMEGWRLWERLQPHVSALIGHVANTPQETPVTRVIGEYASWLHERAQYAEAEPLMRRALAIDEMNLGPDHPHVARDLNNLALLLHATNRLTEAEPSLRRALAIDETSLGPDHPDVARDLSNLALLLKDTNRFTEAEPLMRRALAIDESSLRPNHPHVATRLNNLAGLLRATNRLAEAEPLLRRALAISKASLGPDHHNVGTQLNNLALLLKATNRLTEAEPLLRRALAITETSLGPNHPKVANRLNNLARLLQVTNRLTEAESTQRLALAIDEKSLGPDHPNVAVQLNNLAGLLQDANRLTEAEPLLRRALAIDEKSLGPDHPNVARDLHNLAQLLKATNRLAEAEPLLRRAVAILWRGQFLTGHTLPNTAIFEQNYRLLLQKMEWPGAQIDAHLAAMQREAAGEVDG